MVNTIESNPLIGRGIEECLECVRWCSACVDAGLAADPAMMAASIRLCHECAPMCGLCARLLSANSQFAPQLCAVCADLCEACASECGKHTHVEAMRRSAEASSRCAITCRQIARAGPIRRAA
jgi:hypothetical protein